MAQNYFRNNPKDGALGVLGSRKKLYAEGKKQLHIRDAARNNAWCSVTIGGVTLPRKADTFANTYGRGQNSPKPPPSLTGVTITTAGEWGHALHAEVTFTCYLRSDFAAFDKAWMRTGKAGSISFGYVKPYNTSEQTFKKISDMRVAHFEFNTDSNAHYICRLKLVGVSKFAESAEAKGGLKDRGKFKYKTKSVLGGVETHEVTSLDELLLYDAQENGTTPTDDMADNHKVNTSFGDIIVYHPPSQASIAGALGRAADKAAGWFADKQWTYNHEYYSLEYIVNRLVNDQILGFLKEITTSTDKGIISPVKIICNGNVSVGYGYPIARSADPTSMLILGGARGRYFNPGSGNGKDWESDGEGAGGGISCHKGSEVDLSKIMFERKLITGALAASRDKSEESNRADQTKPHGKTDVLIYVKRFMTELFQAVAYNTGNLFQLDLIENPDNRKQLLVVDRNNGKTDQIKVFVFNPIDGDGSTRDMSLSSGAGSKEYMAAMFGSIIKPSDINSTIKGDIAEANAKRAAKASSIATAIGVKVTKTLPDSTFATDEVEGLRTLMVEYNQTLSSQDNQRKQVVLYPGLKMSVSLDGVWGFGIGNHIHTTLCPKNPYRIQSNGLCFNVQRVRHTFQNNDWQTDLDAVLTFANPIQYV